MTRFIFNNTWKQSTIQKLRITLFLNLSRIKFQWSTNCISILCREPLVFKKRKQKNVANYFFGIRSITIATNRKSIYYDRLNDSIAKRTNLTNLILNDVMGVNFTNQMLQTTKPQAFGKCLSVLPPFVLKFYYKFGL